MIRNRYNRIPHPTADTSRDRYTKRRTTPIRILGEETAGLCASGAFVVVVVVFYTRQLLSCFSLCQGLTVACDGGTPWTFLLTFWPVLWKKWEKYQRYIRHISVFGRITMVLSWYFYIYGRAFASSMIYKTHGISRQLCPAKLWLMELRHKAYAE